MTKQPDDDDMWYPYRVFVELIGWLLCGSLVVVTIVAVLAGIDWLLR